MESGGLMKLLEDKILKEGKVYPGEVLKVDSFVNHQIDVPFISELGKEFYRRFKNEGVNKILTIEASGIGIASLTALHFGCPVVFAKKGETNNMSPDVYTSKVYSYTHQREYGIRVSKDYIKPGDRVLVIDDFLATGNALEALLDIVKESGATLCGAGVVIEKAFQPGGDTIRSRGIRVESLARIASMEGDKITFTE